MIMELSTNEVVTIVGGLSKERICTSVGMGLQGAGKILGKYPPLGPLGMGLDIAGIGVCTVCGICIPRSDRGSEVSIEV
jgi:hypothetical protein